jgi:LCP family protein required for cell wall assembly
MGDELRDLLEQASTRGRVAGAERVLARAEAEVRPHGRRTVRVVIALTTAAAVVAAALIGGGYLYARTKLDDVDRVDLQTALAGSATPAEPMNVLLVGSDTRAGIAEADAGQFGSAEDVGGQRADTIMVVRLEPAAHRAVVLSLPRDLWLPIDGGPSQRVNTALQDGPDALVRTVQDALGIRLDHYVQLDFVGFERLVDAVGGVPVQFGTAVRDRVSGLDEAAGCRTVDGETALAVVRARHVQHLVDGRWLSDPTGDIGRMLTQQVFLQSALAKAGDARDPRTVRRLLDVAADHLTVDDGLSSDDLVDLGRLVADLGADDLASLQLPVENARVGTAAVLRAEPADLLAVGQALTGHDPRTTTRGTFELPTISSPTPGDVTGLPGCDK